MTVTVSPTVKPASTTSKPASTTAKPASSSVQPASSVTKRSVVPSTTVVPVIKKAGLAYNWEFNQNWSPWTSTAGSKVSWGYSWDAHPMLNFPTSKLNFVPMLHGNAADKIQWFVSQIPNFPSWGVTHLLSFNEPDMPGSAGGSDITPAQAAIDHQRVFNSTVSSKYKIGAPAVARGSKAWLQQWVTACNGKCKYDFIPIHFYGQTPQELYDYVTEMHTAFGKPLWITEFAAMDFSTGYSATATQAQAFQNAVLPFLESSTMVERYSWFGLFDNWK
ncbi:hypothetical protein QFC22_001138 [Naganishia vaughanmartiniae]|uniref:Uncharacterized protein n=1 Tax=Naganishia vaughanmartiniae TaxID=1424756 RepID=A0ACC2XL31_9TREE|nr:hypothetical protein QFC22_001138 [Naganishia vaughanmartiniae]